MALESFIGGRGGTGHAIERWLEAGVIDAATAERLRAHEAARRPPRTGRTAIVAFGVGGLLLAAGVFLFVAANWQALAPWTRVAVLLAVIAALHAGGGFGARFSGALATSLHAAGTAALGAGVFLAGQIFHLEEHWPEAFLLWALGAAIAALLLRDWPQILWVAILGPAWLVGEWVSSLPWAGATYGPAAESVVPFGLVVLSAAYLSARAPGNAAAWRQALGVLGALGLVASASSLIRHGIPPGVDLAATPVPPLRPGLAWAIAVALPLAVAFALRGRNAWPVLVAVALAGTITALDAAVTWQRLCIYLVYAAGSVALVGWGMRDHDRLRVNLGVLCLALTVLAFYFSSLFDMLGRALGLIGVGLLCIGGGLLADRARRRLIARLDGGRP